MAAAVRRAWRIGTPDRLTTATESPAADPRDDRHGADEQPDHLPPGWPRQSTPSDLPPLEEGHADAHDERNDSKHERERRPARPRRDDDRGDDADRDRQGEPSEALHVDAAPSVMAPDGPDRRGVNRRERGADGKVRPHRVAGARQEMEEDRNDRDATTHAGKPGNRKGRCEDENAGRGRGAGVTASRAGRGRRQARAGMER